MLKEEELPQMEEGEMYSMSRERYMDMPYTQEHKVPQGVKQKRSNFANTRVSQTADPFTAKKKNQQGKLPHIRNNTSSGIRNQKERAAAIASKAKANAEQILAHNEWKNNALAYEVQMIELVRNAQEKRSVPLVVSVLDLLKEIANSFEGTSYKNTLMMMNDIFETAIFSDEATTMEGGRQTNLPFFSLVIDSMREVERAKDNLVRKKILSNVQSERDHVEHLTDRVIEEEEKNKQLKYNLAESQKKLEEVTRQMGEIQEQTANTIVDFEKKIVQRDNNLYNLKREVAALREYKQQVENYNNKYYTQKKANHQQPIEMFSFGSQAETILSMHNQLELIENERMSRYEKDLSDHAIYHKHGSEEHYKNTFVNDMQLLTEEMGELDTQMNDIIAQHLYLTEKKRMKNQHYFATKEDTEKDMKHIIQDTTKLIQSVHHISEQLANEKLDMNEEEEAEERHEKEKRGTELALTDAVAAKYVVPLRALDPIKFRGFIELHTLSKEEGRWKLFHRSHLKVTDSNEARVFDLPKNISQIKLSFDRHSYAHVHPSLPDIVRDIAPSDVKKEWNNKFTPKQTYIDSDPMWKAFDARYGNKIPSEPREMSPQQLRDVIAQVYRLHHKVRSTSTAENIATKMPAFVELVHDVLVAQYGLPEIVHKAEYEILLNTKKLIGDAKNRHQVDYPYIDIVEFKQSLSGRHDTACGRCMSHMMIIVKKVWLSLAVDEHHPLSLNLVQRLFRSIYGNVTTDEMDLLMRDFTASFNEEALAVDKIHIDDVIQHLLVAFRDSTEYWCSKAENAILKDRSRVYLYKDEFIDIVHNDLKYSEDKHVLARRFYEATNQSINPTAQQLHSSQLAYIFAEIQWSEYYRKIVLYPSLPQNAENHPVETLLSK